MAIKLKQRDKEWRIEIDDEEWKCNDRKDMERILKVLLDLKETKGKLK
jgi:hypothetical protein